MSNVSGVNSGAGVASLGGEFSGNASPGLMVAQLEMKLSKENKAAALDKIKEIKQIHEESRNMTEKLNQLRNLKGVYEDKDDLSKIGKFPKDTDFKSQLETNTKLLNEAKKLKELADSTDKTQRATNKTTTGESESTYMTDEMVKYLQDNGVDFADYGCTKRQNGEEWDIAIKNLEARGMMLDAAVTLEENNIKVPENITAEQIDSMIASLSAQQEEISSSIQEKMVVLQDYMGQYNAYLQGANSEVSKAAETLKSVARGG